MQSAKILVVDDDHFTRTLLDGLLRGRCLDLRLAETGGQARAAFAAEDFNLVLMDQRLPDANGLDLLREFRKIRPRLTAIMITGHADVKDAMAAVREGLFDYRTKPFEDLDDLERVIGKALEMDRAYREIDALKASLAGPSLIGASPVVMRLAEQIRQVAKLDTTVLLEGESGTGKDVVARMLHAESRRAKAPYLDVNCGALPESLLEGLLFGYEKGAFTGAAKTTAGTFEKAHGGSLFLDEIADMSPKLQSSLLRVLQDGAFSRVGATERRSSDFRLICATNRPLAAAVAAGSFREDLFYRINVVVLRLPPLRDRVGDVVLLATHFLDHFTAKFGKKVGPFSPAALRALEIQPWPGNVRQLKHAIERLVALHPGGPVDVPHLDGVIEAVAPGPAAAVGAPGPLGYQQARHDFERDYLRGLLAAAGGNISEAARLSGIPRQNLYVRMKRWAIVTD
ncbi:sigma-54-dependent Fis family transcriptional regulator [Siculibacillus lacustris]|uniref:Sigma-54-dependent Fis family transcriptional regulator n=1 Tax=Siculibacillus lacustris TaxID=1549641 RepID=A0A4Q9VFT1_9HYPH|nr:sigma-54 dependent transcriptional regulator [Siculibacillus lacustris]TBW33790.1 sigma-54-dependent Fis family transcriptional regulator [Siculibacillus lacustris]